VEGQRHAQEELSQSIAHSTIIRLSMGSTLSPMQSMWRRMCSGAQIV